MEKWYEKYYKKWFKKRGFGAKDFHVFIVVLGDSNPNPWGRFVVLCSLKIDFF